MSHLAARALPRLRTRRWRPRSPWWWWRVATFCVFTLLAAVNLAVGNMTSGAGCALLSLSDWRTLIRWPEGSLRGPLPDAAGKALDVGGIGLVLMAVIL